MTSRLQGTIGSALNVLDTDLVRPHFETHGDIAQPYIDNDHGQAVASGRLVDAGEDPTLDFVFELNDLLMEFQAFDHEWAEITAESLTEIGGGA